MENNPNHKIKGLHYTIKDVTKDTELDNKIYKEFENYLDKNKIGYCDGSGAGMQSNYLDVFNYVRLDKFDESLNKFKEILKNNKAEDNYVLFVDKKPYKEPLVFDAKVGDEKYIDFNTQVSL